MNQTSTGYNLSIPVPKPFTYDSAVKAIDSLEGRGWRLGLDRMEMFCRQAGLTRWLGKAGGPQFIHITGTNGKGSTTAFVESLLRNAGLRTGSFFSPYVKDYRERIQSGGAMISKDDLASLTESLFEELEAFSESEFGGITKFEFEAALGFKYWAERECEWVALEVGLGGRLDATNVVTPQCSVIVSISLDHTQILGKTIEEIAFEKAGIIKPGVPVVVGELPPLARQVIEARAEQNGSEVWKFGREILLRPSLSGFEVETPRSRYTDLRPGLVGEMQAHNMALALAALDLCRVQMDAPMAQKAVAETRLPGRFEEFTHHGTHYVVDGAHNPDAAARLVETLRTRYPTRRPWILISSTLSGHDAEAFYAKLAGHFSSVEVPPIANPRAVPAAEGAKIAGRFFRNVSSYPNLGEAIESAESKAGSAGLVLVTGSNYLAGEVLNLFDLEIPD